MIVALEDVVFIKAIDNNNSLDIVIKIAITNDEKHPKNISVISGSQFKDTLSYIFDKPPGHLILALEQKQSILNLLLFSCGQTFHESFKITTIGKYSPVCHCKSIKSFYI